MAIYRRVPVLTCGANGVQAVVDRWQIEFGAMFHMANDSVLFRNRKQLEEDGWRQRGNIYRRDDGQYLPLYEAKMVDVFDHRASQVVISATATIRQGQPDDLSEAQHSDPFCSPQPRYWVASESVTESIPDDVNANWFIGFANVTSPTNHRTVVAAILPMVAVAHSMPLVYFANELGGVDAAAFLGCFTSFVMDYCTRQKLGGINLTFFVLNQLPVLPPSRFDEPTTWREPVHDLRKWLASRTLELTYTAWDLEAFAQDCGWSGPPFRWDEERRFLLRCELDAAIFHLYLPAKADGAWQKAERETEEDLARLKASFPTPRDAVAYIMDTFPIVRRKDEEKHNGDYRTKRVILEIYDAMQAAIRTGQPYQTRLDPPPADPRCCHPPRGVA